MGQVIEKRKRRKRASWFQNCKRAWFKYNGKIYRMLMFDSYEPCYYGGSPKEFYYPLERNDPRPLGLSIDGMPPQVKEAYSKLPKGIWTEVIWESPKKGGN